MGRQTTSEVSSKYPDHVQPAHRRAQPAGHPLLQLQRSAGNQAVQRLLHDRELQGLLGHALRGGQLHTGLRPGETVRGLSVQRQPGTDYGLALAGSQNTYVAEAVQLWTTKKTMKVEVFADTLMKAIKTDLLSQGVPELAWKIRRGSGLTGSFDQKKWLVTIDPDKFSDRKVTTLADLTPDEVREIVGTLYHESRHTDQDVLIVRVLLDKKKSVKDIVRETKIPERIVKKVKATKFKASPDAAQAAHADRMFAVMYGQHNQVLTFIFKNPHVVEGVQSLMDASTANAVKKAAPHVRKLRNWATKVLVPKVQQLGQSPAVKQAGSQEAQLRADLDALSKATTPLLTAYDSASKKLTEAGLEDLQNAANDWQIAFVTAYKNLEGEKDAFAVEDSVKQAFDTAAKAPAPSP